MKMRKYIDADKAIKDYAHYGIKHFYDATDLEAILNECPAADVQEVRHGRWTRYEYSTNNRWRKCSVCGRGDEYINEFGLIAIRNYCPYCGAKMMGGKENE